MFDADAGSIDGVRGRRYSRAKRAERGVSKRDAAAGAYPGISLRNASPSTASSRWA